MEKLDVVTGVAVPLRRANVDTDQILPAVHLRRITKTGYEDVLFERWRQDPDFVLNRSEYREPRILVAGPSFGIGSSREHAVWALRDFGFRVVVGSSFGDIFRGNAGKQGLLVATVAEEELPRLWEAVEAEPGHLATVELTARTITVGALTVPFRIDDHTRRLLLEGLDDIALTLRHEADIAAFEARRPSWLPTTLPPRTGEPGAADEKAAVGSRMGEPGAADEKTTVKKGRDT